MKEIVKEVVIPNSYGEKEETTKAVEKNEIQTKTGLTDHGRKEKENQCLWLSSPGKEESYSQTP